MRRLLAVLALGAAVLLGGFAGAADSASPTLERIVERKEVRVGMSGNQPPFTFKSRSGRIEGFEVALAESMANAMGVKLKLVSKPFARLLPALERGEVDLVMSGVTMTAERSMKFAFVGPYYVSGKSVLTRSDDLASARSAGAFNRDGLTLVALEGSTSQAFVQGTLPKTTLLTAEDYDAAVKLVLEGKAQALVADLPACVVAMLQNPDEGLKTSAALLTVEPIGVALPPGDPLFESYVTNVVEALESTGKIAELSKYWFEGAAWLDALP
jgi:ABC-type amino acid transport substrate-binding protein